MPAIVATLNLRLRQFERSPSVRKAVKKPGRIGEKSWLLERWLQRRHEIKLNERLMIYAS